MAHPHNLCHVYLDIKVQYYIKTRAWSGWSYTLRGERREGEHVPSREMLSLFLFPAIAFAHLTMRSFGGGDDDDGEKSPFAMTVAIIFTKSRWQSRNWTEESPPPQRERERESNHGLVLVHQSLFAGWYRGRQEVGLPYSAAL